MCRPESLPVSLPTAPACLTVHQNTERRRKTLNDRKTLKPMHSNTECRAPKH